MRRLLPGGLWRSTDFVKLWSVGLVAYMVNQVSLRQASTPDRLQGRVSVTMRYVSRSSMPLGALIGSLVGTQIGPQLTLVVSACGMLVGTLWVLRSPVRELQAPGTEEPAPAA